MKSPRTRRLKFLIRQKISQIHFLKLIFISVLILIFMLFIHIYNNSYKPLLKSLAESRASYILNNAVNEGINEVVLSNELMYNDLITVLSDNEGKISGLMTNLVTANRLKTEFSLKINEKINNLTSVKMSIPLGNLTGIDTLAGLGPKLDIRLVPSGKLNLNFKNSFQEAGINQTKHEIYLEAESSVSLLMPTGLYTKVEITSKIPLCESIIVGNIPDTLTRLETSDETLRDDILNIY